MKYCNKVDVRREEKSMIDVVVISTMETTLNKCLVDAANLARSAVSTKIVFESLS